MSEPNETLSVDVKAMETLLQKRILSQAELNHFWCLLYRLWDQAQNCPKDFLEKLFALEQYFHDYIMNDGGPYRPSKEDAKKRLAELIPSTNKV